MLDNVKINRESTTQSELIGKRMKRREVELFKELLEGESGGGKSGASIRRQREIIRDLDREISTIENAIRLAELNESDQEAPASCTVSHQYGLIGGVGRGTFLKTTTRAFSQRAPTCIKVKADDTMLEYRKKDNEMRRNSSLDDGPLLPQINNNTNSSSSSGNNNTTAYNKNNTCRAAFMLPRHEASHAASHHFKSVGSIAADSTLSNPLLFSSKGVSDDTFSVGHEPPTLATLSCKPWVSRSVDASLTRDPYMRKYGLHRNNLHLYSEKMKESLRQGGEGRLLKKIVEPDGCNFEYKGHIRGVGMQRGNVSPSRLH